MTFEQYKAQRAELLEEMQNAISEGDIEASKTAKLNVENLDAKFEEIKIEMSNLTTLKNQENVEPFQNFSTNKGDLKPVENTIPTNVLSKEKLYENAFAKTILNQPLTAEETNVYEFTNATTLDTSAAIPTTLLNEIMTEIHSENPFLGEVRYFNIRGNLSLIKHTAIVSGDAKAYLESEETESEENTFVNIELTGKEVAKYIEMSFKLEQMSVTDLLSYLRFEIVQRVGAELGRQVFQGDGVKEITGVLTAMSTVSEQELTYAASGLTYTNLAQAFGKVGAKHTQRVNIYATNETIWSVLATILDNEGRPIFIPDATSGGVGRIFGRPVKADSGVPTGTIVIGDPSAYSMNVNQDIAVEGHRDIKKRKLGFSAYCTYDGNVTHEKGFVIIKPTI